jgi:putative flippase GtrA
MPPTVVMLAVVALILVFGLFSIYVWKERKGDERETYLKILSGHFAFLTGSFILVLAIAYQELNHILDPWLVYALIGMIIAKIISQYLSNKNN